MNRYLFVIDYQNDFVDGALGFPGAEKLDAGIAAKVREYGPGRVFFTRDTHFENYLETREGRNLPVLPFPSYSENLRRVLQSPDC